MILYPTLELLNGRCVSLSRGRLDAAEIWHVDPIDTARAWAAAGASWMHVTDFDKVQGRDKNADLVQELIRAVGIPVQLAGGLRSADAAADWIDRGAGRIVLSTLAVREPQAVMSLAKAYPDQIVLSVDVWQGKVMVDGWRQESAFDPQDFVRAFNAAPLAAIIVTDIVNDMGDTDGQLGIVSGVAAAARAPVIASGVVRTQDDVARLKYVPNIAGALVGRALFNKSLELSALLEIAQPAPEPVAEFL